MRRPVLVLIVILVAPGACVHAEFSLPSASTRKEGDPPPPPSAARAVFTRMRLQEGDSKQPGTSAVYAAVACYDPGSRVVRAGAACAERIPAGARVRCASSAATMLLEAAPAGNCSPLFSPASANAACDVAVWSADSSRPTVIVVPRVQVQTRPDEMQAIGDRVRQRHPEAVGALDVEQAVSLDIDRDGALDRLLAVRVRGADSSTVAFSGTLLAYASSPADQILLHADPRWAYRLHAVLDLDGDEHPEMWFTATAADGAQRHLVERIGGARPIPIGAVGCE